MAWRRYASLKSTSAGVELLSSSMPASSSSDSPQLTFGVRKGIVQRTVRTPLAQRCETKRNGVSYGWYDNPIIEGGPYVTFGHDDDPDRLRPLLD
jgi:hypothetical protein